MSFLDIDERILTVAKLADIVKSPVVDQKEFPEADITLVEGAVANEEHLEEIKHIRAKTKILISFGDCAVTGNVATLRNGIPKEDVLRRAYAEVPSTAPGGKLPDAPHIARLIDRVRPLHEVVKIDYYLPGCPPNADLIFYVLAELLHDRVPVIKKEALKYG
jgi:NAD-reducing hydrogenase small subunit